MKLEILSHSAARDVCWNKNVIMLSDPEDASRNIELIKLRSKNCLHLQVDDITKLYDNYVAPSVEHVQKIIDFGRTYEVELVCCYAGISRSSATAYILSCLRLPPSEAIKVLDAERHHPNSRIVKIAAKLLNDPEIYEVCKAYAWEEN